MSADPFEDEFPPEASKVRPLKAVARLAPPAEIPVPAGESAFSLLERDIPEPVRLCDPWATEGVNLIAGRPKLGKTTLSRQKLAAAATGTLFLDAPFKVPVKCAFLSLEEGELLCRMKFKQHAFCDEALGAIQLFFDWPRGVDGVDLLDRYLTANPEVHFVVVDSLTKFRTVPDARTPAFMADYDAINLLHEMAKRHPGCCIDVVHHTRKAKSEDPIDDVSGTYGLTAASDCIVVLRPHTDGALLYVYSRLWNRKDSEYKLRRTEGRWEMLGVNLGLTDEQLQALEYVKKSPGGLGGQELGNILGITTPSAWQRLDLLIEHGVAVKRYGKVFVKV